MTQAQFVAGQLQTATYTYDADGRRVKRNMGAGGEVWQVYGVGGELLAEYAANASPSQPQKEYGYRGGELLVTAEAAARTDVALASEGATATASSTYSSAFPVGGIINGDRKGLNWGAGGGGDDEQDKGGGQQRAGLLQPCRGGRGVGAGGGRGRAVARYRSTRHAEDGDRQDGCAL